MALRRSRTTLGLASQYLRPSTSAPCAIQTRRLQHGAPSRRAFTVAQPELETHQLARESDVPHSDGARPRWMQTPEGMKGAFKISVPKDPSRSQWVVNEDPVLLDDVYDKLLGHGGSRLLPDELKWLAVTHKSFDQGRRGFNDRLTYFGRRILVLEATRFIMNMPASSTPSSVTEDTYGRESFQHPDLERLNRLLEQPLPDVLSLDAVATVARQAGLIQVLRWKPKMPENLAASGLRIVLNGALYAIVGAVSLHNGAEVASRIARERILKRLVQLEQ